MVTLTCFKTYDIRGRLGIDLDDAIVYRIGRGFARALGASRVVIGRDVRSSSEALAASVARALVDEGCDVLDLGLSGTEEMYFATTHFEADGGICVTASHNPMDYNGMKMVRSGSAPLAPKTGLETIRHLAEADKFGPPRTGGSVTDVSASARQAYVERVLSFVDIGALTPLRILVNSGNGAAGPTFDSLAAGLEKKGAPLTFLRMNHEPDGQFPNGIPNPLLKENRPATTRAVIEARADFGVAWDGDFDRCFLFDHTGAFVDGEYIVGLLAEVFLAREPGGRIIHDPRVVWNTRDIVGRAGGEAIQAPTGHAFIKQAMRDHGAVYGGEMSAHHYFRDFVHCDSGMIPWLLIAELISRRNAPLARLVEERKSAFPSSGEINLYPPDPVAAIARVRAALEAEARSVDLIDGVSLDMGDWRFNLRMSNTEPVVRLNAESRGIALGSYLNRVESLLQGDNDSRQSGIFEV